MSLELEVVYEIMENRLVVGTISERKIGRKKHRSSELYTDIIHNESVAYLILFFLFFFVFLARNDFCRESIGRIEPTES